ncbi:hypothetical protein F511_18911 [Dorcoceras hygrometricum]|uniref:Uncharacterized protein n=1 Tax=Dorcoceras hygrometricum TaxID=472368 RepID=A0A2Z7CHA4_9LAMI|nr:hypothetical protein F511_18911 [Dorcoceras hygrometricum]
MCTVESLYTQVAADVQAELVPRFTHIYERDELNRICDARTQRGHENWEALYVKKDDEQTSAWSSERRKTKTAKACAKVERLYTQVAAGVQVELVPGVSWCIAQSFNVESLVDCITWEENEDISFVEAFF